MSSLTTFSRRAFLVMPFALAACYNRTQVIELVGQTMGTTYKVVAVDHKNAVDKAEVEMRISAALADVNKAMSNWDDSSEISRINAAPAGARADMSQELAQVMNAAADVNAASQGRFDTTMGPLIELWGFGAPGQTALPSEAAIAAAQAKSGHANSLLLTGQNVEKTREDAQVYLAGIGKGYGADHVGRALEDLGLSDYMVEIGGDLYASGRNPEGMAWQIGIESPDPLARGVMGVVGVSGMGLASSGDYRNYFEADGQRFSHLIDPVTGRPVDHNTASATVLADNAMLADAWSTAMLILGRERGLEVAEQHHIAVHFVDRNADGSYVTHQSAAFASQLA
ncbi:Thiamine biosynthesis lipoprotein ApbE precursor [Pelagimonas phthalicica]|uniref:FAD:protein FMN transferase n=1 Tax=Pelagimonas phthalicica TaxID=1037362 RepID=A0A238JH22_9RHOB|nr:FAD:protein FMN transferase [Pelagimonas phthalicica]TDS92376.1 thiamine biosynthesis lipoprotein [Pelagimonas phthalicica]SMX29437.1 Thiamine biosynthesis lipoprotein ApbE precursor [Pelagimonas phthalicica]